MTWRLRWGRSDCTRHLGGPCFSPVGKRRACVAPAVFPDVASFLPPEKWLVFTVAACTKTVRNVCLILIRKERFTSTCRGRRQEHTGFFLEAYKYAPNKACIFCGSVMATRAIAQYHTARAVFHGPCFRSQVRATHVAYEVPLACPDGCAFEF